MPATVRSLIYAFIALALTAARATAAEPPLWLVDGKPSRQAVQMLEILDAAQLYGLSPQDYRLELAPDDVRAVLAGQATAALRSRFDTTLAAAAARFVTHLQQGRVTAQAAGFHLPAPRSTVDSATTVRQLANSSDVRGLLASLEPRPRPYRMLKQTLQTYRDLARQPGLGQLPPLPQRSIGLGDNYAGAPELRALLTALGDMDAPAEAGQRRENMIDASLDIALKRFQARHGLQSDGVIGARTYTALTTPLSRRVRQIELTLERWRWLAASQQRPDIVVNIPQFVLYTLPPAHQPEAGTLEMPVIVGRSYTSTPVFVAQIDEVIFQPYWDVPSSILHKELLPKIRKNPDYLERHHFEIVRGGGDDATVVAPDPAAIEALAAGRLRLRQRPGADNALGPVKFVLPNAYGIRLHGTSEPALFELPSRAFSHGCIRVSQPADLAEFVLRNAPDKWDADRVETAMCGTQTLRIKLTTPVRVVVFYATAAASESRGALFAEDIYGLDRKLERLLDLRPKTIS